MLDYLASDVPRVWVVYPALRTVVVQRPDGDAHTYAAGDALTSDDAGFAPTGFLLPLRAIFDQ